MPAKLRQQIILIVIFTYTLIYNKLPFFIWRRLWLKLFGISIGRGSVIHGGVRFFSLGKINVGEFSSIGPRCYLDNRKGIAIGSCVNISHDTKIYTVGHDINSLDFKSKGNPVIIDDYACLFANVLVMPGVRIGRGAVVYPGAVVTKSVSDYSVVGGNPAKVIGVRPKNIDYKLDYQYWFAL